MLVATDFGCDPTGVEDSTDAMQRFLLACRGAKGSIPAGRYKISKELIYGYRYAVDGTTAESDGGGTVGETINTPHAIGGTLEGEGTGATVLFWADPPGQPGAGRGAAVLRVSSPGCRIQDLQIDGSGLASYGVVLQNAGAGSFRIYVQNCAQYVANGSAVGGNGIHITTKWGGLTGNEPGVVGINDNVTLENCEVRNNQGSGVFIDPDPDVSGVDNAAIDMRGLRAEGNGQHGIVLGWEGNRLLGVHCKNNGGYGVFVSRLGNLGVDHLMLMPWFEGNASGPFRYEHTARCLAFVPSGAFGTQDTNENAFVYATAGGLQLRWDDTAVDQHAALSVFNGTGGAPVMQGLDTGGATTTTPIRFGSLAFDAFEVVSSPSLTLPVDQHAHCRVTMQSTITSLTFGSPRLYQIVVLEFIQGSGGTPHDVAASAWPAIKWKDGSKPGLTQTARARDFFVLMFSGVWIEIGRSMDVR